MLDKLRSKIVGRQEAAPPSEEAIRSHVLGEIHPPSAPPFPAAPASVRGGRYETEFEGAKPVSEEVPALPDIGPPPYEEFPKTGFAAAPPREFERRFEERGLYELLDRLSVIEAQLATIRAQTETLNERMKTLEMYMRSRVQRTSF